jgi:hypothetical protein
MFEPAALPSSTGLRTAATNLRSVQASYTSGAKSAFRLTATTRSNFNGAAFQALSQAYASLGGTLSNSADYMKAAADALTRAADSLDSLKPLHESARLKLLAERRQQSLIPAFSTTQMDFDRLEGKADVIHSVLADSLVDVSKRATMYSKARGNWWSNFKEAADHVLGDPIRWVYHATVGGMKLATDSALVVLASPLILYHYVTGQGDTVVDHWLEDARDYKRQVLDPAGRFIVEDLPTVVLVATVVVELLAYIPSGGMTESALEESLPVLEEELFGAEQALVAGESEVAVGEVISSDASLVESEGAAMNVRAIPSGFESAESFENFSSRLNHGLDEAGYADSTAVLQGSSVTGTRFADGTAFDSGHLSDLDIALCGEDLMSEARSLGIELRSAGTRTGPLTVEEIRALGLSDIRASLFLQSGRPINFMIFETTEQAVDRGPSIVLPK